MQILIEGPSSVSEYIAGFTGILSAAPRGCPYCGGLMKGHGKYHRWVVSLEGTFKVPIQRMICKVCCRTISLLPRMLLAFYSCTRSLADKVKFLWERGKEKMAAVRYALTTACSSLVTPLSTLYRWASHTS